MWWTDLWLLELNTCFYQNKYFSQNPEKTKCIQMLTCTIHSATYWLDKLINIVIPRTGFDSYRVGCVSTAVTPWGGTDLTGDRSIFQLWVRAIEPQWVISATHASINTWFWHLGSLIIVEQPVPALPLHIIITHAIVVRVVSGSPRLIQTGVVVAWINTWGTEGYYKKKV